MAYIPSMSDIPQDTGYTPSMADIPQDVSPQQSSPSILQQMSQSAPTQFVLGAGDALRQLPIDIGNLATRGINALGAKIPLMQNPQFGSGTSYNLGKVAGNVGGFVAGGEGLDAIRAAQESDPLIGGIARYLGQEGLGGSIGRTAGASAYGALTDPNNPLAGAGEGAAFGALGESVPALFGLGSKALSSISPQTISDSIINNLKQEGGIEENGKQLAKDIMSSYQLQKNAASAVYNPIRDRVGNDSIYSGGTPITDQTGTSYNYDLTPQSIYKNLPQNIKGSYSPEVQDLHDEFSANPTFQNAHALQQQLGIEQRGWQDVAAKNGLEPAQRTIMNNLGTARRAVREDIGNYLTANHPDLAANPTSNAYQEASDFYLDNVVPYRENTQIQAMAMGDVTNPRNLSTIFRNPEPSVQKVVNDLGQGTQNQILYSKLGNIQVGAKPERLLTALQNLDTQGLASYKSPQLQAQEQALASAISRRNWTQALGAGGSAWALTHHFGGGITSELMSGALSGALLPWATRTTMRALSPIGAPAASLAKAAYPALKNAIVSNLLARNQQ